MCSTIEQCSHQGVVILYILIQFTKEGGSREIFPGDFLFANRPSGSKAKEKYNNGKTQEEGAEGELE
jgi:hypothetical protein